MVNVALGALVESHLASKFYTHHPLISCSGQLQETTEEVAILFKGLIQQKSQGVEAYKRWLKVKQVPTKEIFYWSECLNIFITPKPPTYVFVFDGKHDELIWIQLKAQIADNESKTLSLAWKDKTSHVSSAILHVLFQEKTSLDLNQMFRKRDVTFLDNFGSGKSTKTITGWEEELLARSSIYFFNLFRGPFIEANREKISIKSVLDENDVNQLIFYLSKPNEPIKVEDLLWLFLMIQGFGVDSFKSRYGEPLAHYLIQPAEGRQERCEAFIDDCDEYEPARDVAKKYLEIEITKQTEIENRQKELKLPSSKKQQKLSGYYQTDRPNLKRKDILGDGNAPESRNKKFAL